MTAAEGRADRLIHRFHQAMDAVPLCTQIDEHDLVVPGEALDLITSIGREVGVEERYWSILTAI